MVKVWPATVSVPLCALLPPFAFTVNDTVPLPLPLAPAEICTNPELLLALQPQPDGAVTFTLPLPPLDLILMIGPQRKSAHLPSATLFRSVWPAMVSVPLCALLPPFAFTVNDTVPLP